MSIAHPNWKFICDNSELEGLNFRKAFLVSIADYA